MRSDGSAPAADGPVARYRFGHVLFQQYLLDVMGEGEARHQRHGDASDHRPSLRSAEVPEEQEEPRHVLAERRAVGRGARCGKAVLEQVALASSQLV